MRGVSVLHTVLFHKKLKDITDKGSMLSETSCFGKPCIKKICFSFLMVSSKEVESIMLTLSHFE